MFCRLLMAVDVHRHSERRRQQPSESRPCHCRREKGVEDVCFPFTLRNISHCPIEVEYKKKKKEKEKKLPSYIGNQIRDIDGFTHSLTASYGGDWCAAKRNEIE